MLGEERVAHTAKTSKTTNPERGQLVYEKGQSLGCHHLDIEEKVYPARGDQHDDDLCKAQHRKENISFLKNGNVGYTAGEQR